MTLSGNVKCGELVYSGAALAMPQIKGDKVLFQANPTNDGNIIIGGEGVTIPDESADATSGITLDAGEFSPVLPMSDLSKFYYICSDSGDSLIYMVFS